MDYATYTIQISTDSSFVDVVFETNTNANVGHEMTESLPVDTEYWWRVIATDTDSLATTSETFKFTVGYVAIADLIEVPTEYVLQQNYPNPFNPSITVPFALPARGNVEFTVFNVLGREVFSSARVFEAGYHRFLFDSGNMNNELVSGVYFLQVGYNGVVNTQKIVLLK